MVSDWTNNLDAIFYVDEAFADSMDGTVPEWVKTKPSEKP